MESYTRRFGGIAVCTAAIIIISTVTVSNSSAATSDVFSSKDSPGGDHEDYTNPNIYDGKRNFRGISLEIAH